MREALLEEAQTVIAIRKAAEQDLQVQTEVSKVSVEAPVGCCLMLYLLWPRITIADKVRTAAAIRVGRSRNGTPRVRRQFFPWIWVRLQL